jgi:hypothetical protein
LHTQHSNNTMKQILFACILSIPFTGQCQFSFEPNTDSTVFSRPYNSSNLFEFKFIVSSPWLFSSYLELTYDHESTWSYKRFLINNSNGEWIELPLIDPSPDIDHIWAELVDLGFLTLKPEDKVSFKVIKDGKLYELPYEKYQFMYPTDMAVYVHEFSSQIGIRSVNYYAPSVMLNALQNSKQKWYVPELYKASFCYELIQHAFNFEDYRDTYIELYKSEHEKTSNKKGKQKR